MRNDQYSDGKLAGFNQLRGILVHFACNYSQVCKMRLAHDTISPVCCILNFSSRNDFLKFEFAYK
jgi:hypothetical protein